jgi:hypothetical protein
VRSSTPRATLAALALSAALALGGAACTKASSKAGNNQPSSPATNVSPESSARVSDANTVPPGVSGQGSGGGQGQGQAKP